MDAAVRRFLDDVWDKLMTIYSKESKRIDEFVSHRPLQAGVMDYLQVAWRGGKIHIDIDEPLDWTDSSYKIEAGPYIAELTEERIRTELYPSLRKEVEELFYRINLELVF